MNILVIGNGFDLAHGLPTKYTDFLEFCRMIKKVYDVDFNDEEEEAWNKLNLKASSGLDTLKKLFIKLYSTRKFKENEIEGGVIEKYVEIDGNYDEFARRIINNLWIDYFLDNSQYQKDNWIDFESEISNVIQLLDDDMYQKNGNHRIDNNIDHLPDDFFNYYIYTSYEKITYRAIRDKLLNDLNELTRALEIYLCEYVAKIEIQVRLPDIDSIKADHIISFNYSDTFFRLYTETEKVYENKIDSLTYDYIHGRANINNTIEQNNMVLGIDEYLLEDRKNKDLEFIGFKKFYQRIYKKTGCKYKEWLEEIQGDYRRNTDAINNCIEMIKHALKEDKMEAAFNWFNAANDNYDAQSKLHYLYIFGHSLDVTDKDILKDLILNDNIYTIIYYFNKDDLGTKISNLVKVIGQDELIRRTSGNKKTIEFRLQQELV